MSATELTSTQTYLGILQDNISRMHEASKSCKNWCLSLITALGGVAAALSKPELVTVAIVPLIVFVLLDAFYLGLERDIISKYNKFVEAVSASETLEPFNMKLPSQLHHRPIATLLAIFSFSIWPFYLLQGVLILIVVKNAQKLLELIQ